MRYYYVFGRYFRSARIVFSSYCFFCGGGHRGARYSGSIRELICSPMLLDTASKFHQLWSTPERCMAIFDLLNLLILIELFVCVDVIEKLTDNRMPNHRG